MIKRVKPWKQLYHRPHQAIQQPKFQEKHPKILCYMQKEGERHIMYTSSRMCLIVIDGTSRRLFILGEEKKLNPNLTL
jgi:hypothetical protein